MMTSTAPEDRELAHLPVTRMQDVLLARVVARDQAERLGFSAPALTQIATAVSEITRNVVQHAGSSGQITVHEIARGNRVGLRIAVEDAGVGIASVDHALAGTTPGAGIAGCRRLMDEFEIRSDAGRGTTVVMLRWLNPA